MSDQLVIHLARAIVGERLKPGEQLPSEAQLAAQFGTSKVVTRESLQSLAMSGLIHIRQGKRTTVAEKSEWNPLMQPVQHAYWLEGRAPELIGQLYEVRRVLETRAVTWAAARAEQEDLKKLEDAVEGMRHIARTSRDTRAFLQVDLGFHDAIATAAGNVVLRSVLRHIHSSPSSWARSQIATEDLVTVAEQHARIAAAIRARNLRDAERAMEDHLHWAQQMETSRSELAVHELPGASIATPSDRL